PVPRPHSHPRGALQEPAVHRAQDAARHLRDAASRHARFRPRQRAHRGRAKALPGGVVISLLQLVRLNDVSRDALPSSVRPRLDCGARGSRGMSFSVILTERGGPTRRLDFDAEEITIGRVDENDICLPKGNISKKHTRIVVKDGRIIVLDLKSTNGTYVNGKKLAGPQVISPDDKVYSGDFILNVEPPDLDPARTNGQPQDGDAMAEMPT